MSYKFQPMRDGAALGYCLGCALTYKYVTQTGRVLLTDNSDLMPFILKNMVSSFFWPVYWIGQVLGF